VSYRRKLLLVFVLTVVCSIAVVAMIVAATTRRAFEKLSADRTQAVVAQYQHEFDRRGEEVGRRIATIAGSDSMTRMALAIGRSGPDYAAYLNEAKTIAGSQHLDFLQFVDQQGTILSSAQAPAKFGYKADNVDLGSAATRGWFLKLEDVSNESVLGVFAVHAVEAGDKPVYVEGGEQINREFMKSLDLPAGMHARLYQYRSSGFSPHDLIDPENTAEAPEKLAPIILAVQQRETAVTDTVHWSPDPEENESVQAIPLRGRDNRILGAFLVGSEQRPYVELARRIRSIALLVGGAGILVSVLLSFWAAARFSKPIGQLAAAAREVASGNWNTRVDLKSRDELGELAEAFNRMTGDLMEQKERLVQAERVAAWRELARRLAHELKNPLFPLQITVENMMRAREQSPEMFEEIFRESTSTLLAEIATLKSITGRFSEFSKMPQPHFQDVDLNGLVEGVARLFDAQLKSHAPPIRGKFELERSLPRIAADPELLHKAISNLVINAVDAMPNGGELVVRTAKNDKRVRVEVSDMGVGLTGEECERLFTPYYTSKQHGTGLGLAIVQSIVSDHGGRIAVDSTPARGTTFKIELPLNLEKLANLSGSSREVQVGQRGEF